MSRTVFCSKLQTESDGLDKPPFPGPRGQKLFDNVSKKAWQMWLAHQTMLINEYRLNMMETKSREFLYDEMDKFLFGDGSEKPSGFTPE